MLQAHRLLQLKWNQYMSEGCTYSLTQQQAFTVGLQCSGEAKQQRHQRDCMNALLQHMKQIWRQGGRRARFSDRFRDSTKALYRATPRADARSRSLLRTGLQSGSTHVYLNTHTHGAYTARSSTYAHSDVCMYNFWTEELKRWDNGGSYAEKKNWHHCFVFVFLICGLRWTVHVSCYHTLKLHTQAHTSHTGESSRPLLQLRWPSTWSASLLNYIFA